jgi:hypothetical protein
MLQSLMDTTGQGRQRLQVCVDTVVVLGCPDVEGRSRRSSQWACMCYELWGIAGEAEGHLSYVTRRRTQWGRGG